MGTARLPGRVGRPHVGAVRMLGILLAISCVLIMTLRTAIPVHAHPADMYFHGHAITLTPDGFVVSSTIQPGPMLSIAEWYEADTNQNNAITSEEAAEWAALRLQEFDCVLDGTTALSWTLVSVKWPSSMEALELGDEAIHIEMQAEWPPLIQNKETARHHLMLHFRHAESVSVNWYYLHGEDGMTFDVPDQNNGRLHVAFHPSASSSLTSSGLTYWDSGSPTLAGSVEAAQTSQSTSPGDARQSTAILTDLIRTPRPSTGFYLAALVIALVLGSIHALTPGHGKALVAAYLIGSRGTIGHAAGLGGIVTLTHTGSVLIFGLITLILSRFLLPGEIFPYLELASGLLIVVMSIGLLWPRWQGYRRVIRSRRRGRIRVVHSPETDRGHQPGKQIVVNQSINTRTYDNLLPDDRRTPDLAGNIQWRSLFALGISGGLVPCPDAIAILLVAIAINRILLGLGLVAMFSFGMAIVLIFIGIAVVRGRLLVSRVDVFSRISPILPLVSAVTVLGIGLVMIVSVMLRNDLFAPWKPGTAQIAPSESGASGFTIEKAGIIYLAHDVAGTMQIYSQLLSGKQPKQLSNAPKGVRDYEVSPDGASVGYTVTREEGNGIWIVPALGGKASQVVDCQKVYCANVTWSPDGAYLIYERLDPYSTIAVPTLWSYALEDGTTRPVFQDEQMPGYSARWSPDGSWLSYLSYPGTPTIELYNLQTGQGDSIPSETGQIAVWSPDSASILLTRVLSSEGTYVSHLYRYDLGTKQLTELSPTPTVEDVSASWSPNGDWLAVVRRERVLDNEFGSQIWLMRPDGSDAHPVTAVPDVMHSTPAWSPDGQYLLVQQIELGRETATQEVWLINLTAGAYERLLEEGVHPGWRP